MASYDSDTSSEGGNDVSTNVTLGYASTDLTGDEISHIGGQPSWLENKALPPGNLAKCKVCNGYLSLLLQLHADLQQYFPNDQRRLHIWCCRKKTCSKKPGSVRTFREVKKQKTQRSIVASGPNIEPAAPKQDLGSQLFGGTPAISSSSVNPFASGTKTSMNGNPFASASSLAAKPPQNPVEDQEQQPPTESFAQKLKIGNSQPESTSEVQSFEPWPPASAFSSPFPFFYLDAETEYLDPTPPQDAESSQVLDRSQFEAEDNTTSAVKSEKDAFESSLDRTFQKFSDTIAQNSEQVLRYDFKGTPLLYSSTDNTATHFTLPHGKTGPVRGIPRCESCGSQRVFEVQLVPGLIYEVEKDDTNVDLDAGMEWGTIIVGTCVNNCGDDEGQVTFREEWTGVQWEERTQKK